MLTSSESPNLSWPRRTLLWLLIGVISLTSVYAGVQWRQWWFYVTTPVHFHDIERNWLWGTYTFRNIHDKGRSFLDTYDDVGIQNRRSELWIDYAPLRLVVNTLWVASNHEQWPYQWHKSTRYRSDLQLIYDYHAFYRWFNSAMEALAAIGAFLLVYNVVRRSGSGETRSAILALIGGLLLWFNPAMIISAHGWPSGDMWVVPPFLWAVYLARVNRWLGAGIVMALGTLFKGQLFFVMAIMIAWPLLQLRWREPLRFIAGFFGAFGLLTSGWTLTYIDPEGFRQFRYAAVVMTGIPSLLLIAYMLLRWKLPKLRLDRLSRINALTIWFGLSGALAFSSMWLFGTCYAWFDASYAFGTDHWQYMVMGKTSNIPGIMTERYGWDLFRGPLSVFFTAYGWEVTVKTFLFGIFLLLLGVSAIGIAMHDRRNSTRFLIAIVTPWLLFFTVPCQIHERYLLFAACAACVCIGHSIGMTLLGVFCTILTGMMTLHVMFIRGNLQWSDQLLNETAPWLFAADGFVLRLNKFIVGTFPDIGWAVIVVTCVFVWMTITPIWRPRRQVALRECGSDSAPD